MTTFSGFINQNKPFYTDVTIATSIIAILFYRIEMLLLK